MISCYGVFRVNIDSKITWHLIVVGSDIVALPLWVASKRLLFVLALVVVLVVTWVFADGFVMVPSWNSCMAFLSAISWRLTISNPLGGSHDHVVAITSNIKFYNTLTMRDQ